MITIQEIFNGPRDFPVSGQFFKLLSTVNPVDVRLSGALPGVEQAFQVTRGFWVRSPFDRIRITTSSNETVKFIVLDGAAGYDSVFLTDEGRERTMSGLSFWGQVSFGPTALNNSHVQFYNPGASVKRRVLKQLIVSASIAGPLIISPHNTALTGLQGNPRPKQNTVPSPIGSDDAELRTQDNVGLLISAIYAEPFVQANTPLLIPLSDPIVLGPGCGLTVVPFGVNIQASLQVEYFNEAL